MNQSKIVPNTPTIYLVITCLLILSGLNDFYSSAAFLRYYYLGLDMTLTLSLSIFYMAIDCE